MKRKVKAGGWCADTSDTHEAVGGVILFMLASLLSTFCGRKMLDCWCHKFAMDVSEHGGRNNVLDPQDNMLKVILDLQRKQKRHFVAFGIKGRSSQPMCPWGTSLNPSKWASTKRESRGCLDNLMSQQSFSRPENLTDYTFHTCT